MSFSASTVKELREKTGAGMMDCKKALEETKGDFEKAIDFLRTKGLAAAQKKQSRVAAEGLVINHIAGNVACMVEVNCETDFVAKNADFVAFVNDLSKLVATNKPACVTVEEGANNLASMKLPHGRTVAETVSDLTLKIGEKISVRRFNRVELQGNGLFGSYVHNGKIAVLVELGTESTAAASKAEVQELSKDISMHVAAAAPTFLQGSEMDEGFKTREAEIYTTQLREQGKKEEMIANIVKGKLAKLAQEVCLLEQKFVKNQDIAVSQLIADVSKQVGEKLTVRRFLEINLGEGIEKRQDNLADEVAKMTKKA